MISPLGLADMLNLENVPRWVICPRLKQQSVAEHSFNVAAMVLRMCNLLFYGRDHAADLMMEALMHDADEAYTGDIPSTYKTGMETGGLTGRQTAHSYVVRLMDLLEAIVWYRQWGGIKGKARILDSLQVRWEKLLNECNDDIREAAITIRNEVLIESQETVRTNAAR